MENNKMKSSNQQSGFSIIEVLIIAAMIIIVGFLGYAAYNAVTEANKSVDNAQQSAENNVESAIVTDVPAAPESIKDTSDLDATIKLLDEIDLSETNADTTSLDSQSSEF